jgi:hypothetical protein
MDFQHLIRAFIKMMDKVKYYKKLAEDNFVSSVDDLDEREKLQQKYDKLREVYAIMFDNCDVKDKHIFKLQEKHQKEVDNAEYWKTQYRIANDLLGIKGDKKMFSEIPNNSFGKSLVDNMKAYLNKDSYKMRVRGQYLDEETKQSEGWRKYDRGQPIDKSKCLRVYIDTK